MEKKLYRYPTLTNLQNTMAIIPLAAIAAVAGPVVTSVASVGVPLAAGYAVGRGVKTAMEFRPDEPRIPVLKKVCD